MQTSYVVVVCRCVWTFIEVFTGHHQGPSVRPLQFTVIWSLHHHILNEPIKVVVV
jgi:hypothetical protein